MADDPKATKGDLQGQLDELRKQNADLAAQVARLSVALEQSVGGREAVEQAMEPKRYVLVQFTREHNAAGRPLSPHGRKLFIQPYHATGGQIMKLPTFEVGKLNEEYPGLLITDEAKFKPMTRRELLTDPKTGKQSWGNVEYPVADVLKHAREIG